MSAFTFTAPIVTPEEERAEREALSDEERARLRHDLHGSADRLEDAGSDTHYTDIAKALSLMQSAIDDFPEKEKIDYMEALEQVPELIQAESNPIQMLRTEHFDIDKAARRLVDFWKIRMALFGKDRCFLPMTLDGAMAEDLETLQKGLFLELAPDKHGRPVFYMDRMRCIKEVAPRDSICRCFWYVLHTCQQQGNTQVAECVWLVNYRGYDLYKHFDRILTKKLFWTKNVQPVIIKSAHFCRGPGSSVSDIVLPVIKQMLDRYMRLRILVHSGSNSEVLQDMMDYGLDKDHVDRFFDGLITNGAVTQRWLEQCRMIEKAAPEVGCDNVRPLL